MLDNFSDITRYLSCGDKEKVMKYRTWFLSMLGPGGGDLDRVNLHHWPSFRYAAINAIYEDISEHEAWCAWMGGLSGPFGKEIAASYEQRIEVEEID